MTLLYCLQDLLRQYMKALLLSGRYSLGAQYLHALCPSLFSDAWPALTPLEHEAQLSPLGLRGLEMAPAEVEELCLEVGREVLYSASSLDGREVSDAQACLEILPSRCKVSQQTPACSFKPTTCWLHVGRRSMSIPCLFYVYSMSIIY